LRRKSIETIRQAARKAVQYCSLQIHHHAGQQEAVRIISTAGRNEKRQPPGLSRQRIALSNVNYRKAMAGYRTGGQENCSILLTINVFIDPGPQRDKKEFRAFRILENRNG
jgi:hypothetical protein